MRMDRWKQPENIVLERQVLQIFYPYDSYTIEGNTLICQYSKVESFFDEQSETGEHRYQLTSNGNLIADQEVWFRHNMFVRMRISNIPETGRDKRESCKSIL